MSNFIREYTTLQSEYISKICDYVTSDVSPFEKSELYMIKEQTKTIDESFRVSEFKRLIKQDLFDLVDNLISEINKVDKTYNFFLVRNDLTYIRYKEGGFFKAHEDYLSFTSNVFEEYTMILCEDACCEGGRTIFKINEFFTYASEASKTKHNIVIFRKDLMHEGEILKSGHKNIITLNLLAVPKNSNNYAVVKCNDSDKYFTLTKEEVEQFDNFIKLEKDKQITYINLENINTNTFETIYKIYKKQYISVNNYKNNKDLLNTLNINPANILFSFESNDNTKKNKNFSKQINENVIIVENDIHYINMMKEKLLDLSMPFIPFTIVFAEGSTGSAGHGESSCDNIKMTSVYMSIGDNNRIVYFTPLIINNITQYKFEPSSIILSKQINYPDRFLINKDYRTYEESENEESENEESENEESENEESENEESENKESENKESENKESENKESENKESENKESEKDIEYCKTYDKYIDDIKQYYKINNIRTEVDKEEINSELYMYKIVELFDECEDDLIINPNLNMISQHDDFGVLSLLMNREYSNTPMLIDFTTPTIKKKLSEYICVNDKDEIVLIPKETKNKMERYDHILEHVQEMLKNDVEKDIIKNMNDLPFELKQKHDSYSENLCNETGYGNFTFLVVKGFMRIE